MLFAGLLGLRMAFMVMCMKLGDLSDDAEEGGPGVGRDDDEAFPPTGSCSGAGRLAAPPGPAPPAANDDDIDNDDADADDEADDAAAAAAAAAAEDGGSAGGGFALAAGVVRAMGRSNMRGNPAVVTCTLRGESTAHSMRRR